MKKLILLLTLASTVVLAGCGTTMYGPEGSVARYSWGSLDATMPFRVTQVHQAAEETVQDLGLNITRSQIDALSGSITARSAEDERVVIDMNAVSEGATDLSIRVGMVGDADKSQFIYEQIRSRLAGERPQQQNQQF